MLPTETAAGAMQNYSASLESHPFQPFRGRKHRDSEQFRTSLEVSSIKGNDCLRLPIDCRFQHHLIVLILQLRPPIPMNLHLNCLSADRVQDSANVIECEF